MEGIFVTDVAIDIIHLVSKKFDFKYKLVVSCFFIFLMEILIQSNFGNGFSKIGRY